MVSQAKRNCRRDFAQVMKRNTLSRYSFSFAYAFVLHASGNHVRLFLLSPSTSLKSLSTYSSLISPFFRFVLNDTLYFNLRRSPTSLLWRIDQCCITTSLQNQLLKDSSAAPSQTRRSIGHVLDISDLMSRECARCVCSLLLESANYPKNPSIRSIDHAFASLKS